MAAQVADSMRELRSRLRAVSAAFAMAEISSAAARGDLERVLQQAASAPCRSLQARGGTGAEERLWLCLLAAELPSVS